MAAYERFAGVYDRLNRAVDYDRYGDYLCGLLARFGVVEGLVLDLACGTGQMAVRLVRRGYEVIGVDASVDMLCQARETLAAAGADCLLLNQRMEALDLYGTVGGCVCTFDSLNHLPELEAVRAAVERVALFLEPGGVFVFDVNTPFKHEQVLGDRTFVLEDDGCYLVWQNAYDPDTCTVELTLDLFE
ncbi:MAG: class I SAM-dependent methyltransferase [Clostridiales bacterium]|nr:class I SAM-dependent methyltransferase [Clostridiales bacterium]